MKYENLGTSDLKISQIGFGCMSLEPSQRAANRIIHKAIDEGVNFFDTADLYQQGHNEVMVGKALSGRRKEIILSTKVGNQWRPDGSGWDWNPSKDYILKAVDESLRRLKTDHIDLYQLHGGTTEDPIEETIEAFETLMAQGKVRYYGISSIRPNVIREYLKKSNLVSVMMQYSLLDRRPEESCLGLLAERHVGLLARGTLAKGMLVGKPPGPYLDHTARAVRKVAKATNSFESDGYTSSQVALGYVLSQAVVASAVVGLRTDQQLASATIQPIPTLTAGQMEVLRKASPALTYSAHR